MKRAIICCLLCVALLPFGSCTFGDEPIRISDFSQYDSIIKKGYDGIFPETIPEGATVVDFYFYFYSGGFPTDVYLELNFDTVDYLIQYVEAFKQKCGEDDIYMLQNHKIEHYTDLFRISESASGGGENNRTYFYKFSDGFPWGVYAVTSYSTKDLSVVITYICGDNITRFTPRYFERFDIKRDEEYSVIIPNGESNLK